MYHTMYPPQMMVQIMGGQHANGQYLSTPTQMVHINGTNVLSTAEYTQYIPDVSGHNRHHMMQTGSYSLELLQLMGVDIPSLRHIDYVGNVGTGSGSGNWPRRIIPPNNNSPLQPPTHLNFRPSNNNSIKKQHWSNKTSKKSLYRENFMHNDKYNSDSGFSSRSPTPSKYQADSSQNESSDERDSITSSIEQGIKKLHRVQSDYSIINNKITEEGFIPSASAHQFYQNQRPINYYPAFSTPRTLQNYQNKRRYQTEIDALIVGKGSPPPPRSQRSKKFTGVILPGYSMFPRYITAPDRFLARSHLVEVNYTPADLITGSTWDKLSQDIWKKFITNQQTEVVYRNKMNLWKYLYVLIKGTFPKYGLFLVGSTMNGFGSDNSDVDMCLLVRHTEMDQRNEAVGHLDQILRCLKRSDIITQLELIQAKVPILKFHDAMQNLDVDLNCNNAVGIRNTHLLYCYSQIDWRVRPLVLIVKLWAQSQNINDAKNMTISSYSLVLMVIHFLQCGVNPPVLPCLHSLYVGKFGPHTDIHSIDINEKLNIPHSWFCPTNRQPLGELLVEFFRYYVTFDFSQYAISVRLARKVLIENCRRARSLKNDPHQWKCLCIEEPFDLTNTARSVYDPDVFARIKLIFDCTYQKLKEGYNLASIFVKVNPMSSYV
ncbi:poly(A) RNA polymerase gld-2 homolog A-like isoform X1 [Polistes fuscatus]|uniref:poly(A) RNA polymerase gld-2 homolog A-like isoform X1 n=3 Tax=Polistes fuscatus TaxID=30207 RepID=UPI001CAA0924|nr:poly(A) RNA polymerase gld-2 homolog A-like isoform X1 [Polistes fuscatus]XP_043486717.1 poly(A) RNA polymerase gld-2 homolog A-like isoform X1 [Polistes fuscatus]XP_043486718.1 poly(A) RNA polymerase gld-2 homolog A-like isoform X1 [Polistes fuscatus]